MIFKLLSHHHHHRENSEPEVFNDVKYGLSNGLFEIFLFQTGAAGHAKMFQFLSFLSSYLRNVLNPTTILKRGIVSDLRPSRIVLKSPISWRRCSSNATNPPNSGITARKGNFGCIQTVDLAENRIRELVRAKINPDSSPSGRNNGNVPKPFVIIKMLLYSQ